MTGFGYETATTFGMDTVERIDKRFSQLFFTVLEPSSKIESLDVSAETKRRVDQRFTQLFSMTPGSETRIQDGKKSSSKSGLRSRLRNFFSSPTSTPSKQQTSPSTSTSKAQRRASSIFSITLSTSSSSNTNTSTKKAELSANAKTLKKLGPVTVNPPLPSFSHGSIFTTKGKGKGKSIPSIHDSKFSSISSLPSLASLALPSSTSNRTSTSTPLLHLSPPALRILHSFLRRLKRGLKKQEYLTTHLSNNLVFLFGRKERQIEGWKRVTKADREVLLGAVFRVKEGAGRLFLRKAVFLQRSWGVCAQLEECFMPPNHHDTHSKDKNSAAGPSSSSGVEISPETIRDFIGMLHADLGNQKALDGLLRQIVCGPEVERWGVKSVNERITIKRFVQFVEGRLALLGDVYERLEEVGCVMEGCLGEGKGD
jgi:hypothetical protein